MKKLIAIALIVTACHNAEPVPENDCNDAWNEAYDVAVIDMTEEIDALKFELSMRIDDVETLEKRLNEATDYARNLEYKIQIIEKECNK